MLCLDSRKYNTKVGHPTKALSEKKPRSEPPLPLRRLWLLPAFRNKVDSLLLSPEAKVKLNDDGDWWGSELLRAAVSIPVSPSRTKPTDEQRQSQSLPGVGMELWSPVAEIIRRSSEPSQCLVQSGDGARQQGMCGEIVPAMHRLGELGKSPSLAGPEQRKPGILSLSDDAPPGVVVLVSLRICVGGQRDDNILICGVLSISLWFKNAMVPRSGSAGSDSVSG
ncbi:unnamed protein product [Arabidopsis thaliana]|uniref:Uncharacterized protein n=1 Tax=Arabidopsis thaliana TaxID=3702 RepID=A0A5S9XSX6_ARATH|nr:unnamed protein product [Arabidopsis thaliana]VYS62887.1 unnamed protein product [Arabidopsis thaliana]